MKIFKLGFTLAEVMIAVAIVGIVASITMPVLMTNFTKDANLNLYKKFVNDLDHAVYLMKAENYRGDFDSSRLGKTNSQVKEFIEDYLKMKKDCGASPTNCFASSYKSFNHSFSGGYGAQIKNGVSVYIIPKSSTSNAKAYVDVNGKKGPNVYEKDLFTVNICDDFSARVDACE